MKKAILDFKEVQITGLDGTPVIMPSDWTKVFGDRLYIQGSSIAIAELGSKLYHSFKKDNIVELDKEEIDVLLNAVETTPLLGAMMNKALIEYIQLKSKHLK